MKRFIAPFFACLVLLFLLVGCSTSKKTSTPPQVDDLTDVQQFGWDKRDAYFKSENFYSSDVKEESLMKRTGIKNKFVYVVKAEIVRKKGMTPEVIEYGFYIIRDENGQLSLIDQGPSVNMDKLIVH